MRRLRRSTARRNRALGAPSDVTERAARKRCYDLADRPVSGARIVVNVSATFPGPCCYFGPRASAAVRFWGELAAALITSRFSAGSERTSYSQRRLRNADGGEFSEQVGAGGSRHGFAPYRRRSRGLTSRHFASARAGTPLPTAPSPARGRPCRRGDLRAHGRRQVRARWPGVRRASRCTLIPVSADAESLRAGECCADVGKHRPVLQDDRSGCQVERDRPGGLGDRH